MFWYFYQELAKYQQRAKEQTQTEIDLRGQVELYTNKYDEFQTALSRSNEVFGGFKEEMERVKNFLVFGSYHLCIYI